MDKGEIIEAEVMPVNKNDRNGLTTFNQPINVIILICLWHSLNATPNTLRNLQDNP